MGRLCGHPPTWVLQSSSPTPIMHVCSHLGVHRSSFLGSGAWVAHWGGDNAATWNDLRWSLSTVKQSGLHGMPMIGVVSSLTLFTAC